MKIEAIDTLKNKKSKSIQQTFLKNEENLWISHIEAREIPEQRLADGDDDDGGDDRWLIIDDWWLMIDDWWLMTDIIWNVWYSLPQQTVP